MRLARLAAVLAAAAVLAPAAQADGLPVLGVEAGGTGVEAGDAYRYVTFTLRRQTVLARVEQAGGHVASYRVLPGRFTIPAVAYDGSAAGLSADRRTLVLVRPRVTFPQRTTRFAVLDPRRRRAPAILTLRGDFSFDAVSPDGRWLYLVEYLSPDDPNRYLVRLYDLDRRRLLAEPIIDPREVGDVMRGIPLTRASSADGRWAYTLYDGAGGHPFVHALDTVGRTARCIDLHGLDPSLSGLRLEHDAEAGSLVLATEGDPLFVIDTETYEVRLPEQLEPEAEETAPREDDFDWALVALSGPGAVVVGGALTLARRRLR